MYLSGTYDNITEEESFIASFYPEIISSPNLVSPKDNLTDANVSQILSGQMLIMLTITDLS